MRHIEKRKPPGAPRAGFLLNLRILRELNDTVVASGAELVVIDAFGYVESNLGRNWKSDLVRSYCAENDIGHLLVSDRLLHANEAGIATRWDHDGHFNEAGNQILADAMYDFMTRERRL